ncbi:MAG: serine/threonine-protein phosphatase [Microcystis panniformis Mp_MB_F_20051200_S9D]|nr:MAG: serine/threonine-protein phosphatase [Microcystis panniformis Mp_MB_F_20051200_S9D]
MVAEQLKQQYKFSYKQFSIIGKRTSNEDRVRVINNNDWQLLLLADGMGGYSNGEAAAELAIDILTEYVSKAPQNAIEDINNVFINANNSISEKLSGAGTTIGGVLLSNGHANIFWAGDVRVYLIDSFNTKYVTKDHSLAQLMRDSKTIVNPTEIDRFKNTVTRGLGGNSSAYLPDKVDLTLSGNSKGLICSDGVHGLFSDAEVFSLLGHQDESFIIDSLEERIYKKGMDNASAVLFSYSYLI